MKILLLFCALFFSFASSTDLRAHAVISEERQCYNKSDLDDFETRWRISSTIEFHMGHVFCGIQYSDETDVCATQYAMDSDNVIELLSSYHKGTVSCGLQIIASCSSWCVSYMKDKEFCRSKCQLPNFQTN